MAFHPGLKSDFVFDGNMTTHRTIVDGRVTVHFDGIVYVSALRIRTIYGHWGTLTVRDHQSRILYNDNFPSSSPTIFFTSSSLTNVLHMKFNSSLDIAEIEVFGGKNVALWKSTDQSSTYSANGIGFTSDKAVDGNEDGNLNSHTCTHTQPGSDNPTWNVNLGNAYNIFAIKIKNRNDNQNRINGFKIFGTTKNGIKLLIYSDYHPTQNRQEIFIDSTHMPDVPIKVINIEGPNTGERIRTLCEVFVYASIKNKHGNFCPEKCQTNSNCTTDNLVCPTCRDGWGGPYCYRITCQRPTVRSPLQIATDPNKQTFGYNESIEFRCEEGYDLDGSIVQRCTQDGILQQNLPTCSRITCQRPRVRSPLQIATDPNKQTFYYEEAVEFRCKEGYDLNGPAVQHCIQNEFFLQNFPTCSPIRCEAPAFPNALHIFTDKQTYNYNDTILFSCFEGFHLQATQMRRCTKYGTLQPPYPICRVITCQRPILTSELHLASNPFKQTFYFNESVSFFCSVGFHLQG